MWWRSAAARPRPCPTFTELLSPTPGARTISLPCWPIAASSPSPFAASPIFSGRRLVGFVLVRVAADEAEILTIAVRPRDRRRGYGRMLMEEALRRLYRNGAAACFLEVDRGNGAAIALYRSLGYQPAGERKNYYRGGGAGEGTALVMRVQLR